MGIRRHFTNPPHYPIDAAASFHRLARTGTASKSGRRLEGAGQDGRKAVALGVRPEDMEIAARGKAPLTTTLYSLEPTGDMTLLAVKAADQLIVAKGPRNFAQELDTPIGFTLPKQRRAIACE